MNSLINPDGIHLTVPIKYHNSILERFSFFDEIDSRTGEFNISKYGNTISRATSRDIKFHFVKSQYASDHLHVHTSLPKFHKGNNYTNLSRIEYQGAIRDLSNHLGVPLNDLDIRSFEFGCNVTLEHLKADDILNSIITCKKRIPDRNTFKGKGIQILFPHQEFTFKIYNKGKQMQLPTEIIRVELIIHKMLFAKKHLDIQNLNHLQTPKSQQLMENMIKNKINDLIFVDRRLHELKQFIPDQSQLIHKYGNPNFWVGLKANRRQKHKLILNSLNEKLPFNAKEELIKPLNTVKQNQFFLSRK